MMHKIDKLNGLLKAEELVSESRELGVVFAVVSKIINTAKEENLKRSLLIWLVTLCHSGCHL